MAFTSIKTALTTVQRYLPAVPIAAALHPGAETAKQLIMHVSHHANANPATLAFAGLATMALATASTLWLGSRIHARDIAKNPSGPPRTWGSSFREASLYPAMAFVGQALSLGLISGVLRYTTQSPSTQESILQGASVLAAMGAGLLATRFFVHDFPPLKNEAP